MAGAIDHKKDNTGSDSRLEKLISASLPSGLTELPLDQIQLKGIQVIDFDKMKNLSGWEWFGCEINFIIACEQKINKLAPVNAVHKYADLLADKAVPYRRQLDTLRQSIAELKLEKIPRRLTKALDRLDRAAGQALRRGWAYRLQEVKDHQAEDAAFRAEHAFEVLMKEVLSHECSEYDWKAVIDASQVWLTGNHGQDNDSLRSIAGALIKFTDNWEKLIDQNEQISSLGTKEMRRRLGYIYETAILPMIGREIEQLQKGLSRSKIKDDAPQELQREWTALKLLAHSPSEDQLFSPSEAAAFLQAVSERPGILMGSSYLKPVLERFLIKEDSVIYPEVNYKARWLLTLIWECACFRSNLAGDLVTTDSQARNMLEDLLRVESRFEQLKD